VSDSLYAVIMAGGVGSRLWPRSRSAMPKQFLDLVGPRTMLQETVDRLDSLIPLERVFVVASKEHAPAVRSQIPGLPVDNILVEPGPRGTAPCIGLAAVAIRRCLPDAVMAVFPADHRIVDTARFQRAIAAAEEVAQDGYLVTLGITPSSPHTGYGYIQRGVPLKQVGALEAFRVQRFAEKPEAATARQFVDSGQYYWNAGIFVWRTSHILEEMARHLPGLYVELQGVTSAWDTPRRRQVLDGAWERVPRTTIDYGILEKASQVAVLPVDIGWDDVGDWAALAELVPGDEAGNSVSGGGRHLLQNTASTYVYTTAGRLVAVVGLEDLIVVDTPDALLVCPKDRTQAVRDLVARLKSGGLEEYL